jgi:hypothetical protein
MTASPKDCQICEYVQREIESLKKTQKDRHCGENTKAIQTLEGSDIEQWQVINELRRTVWGWRGGMALASFLGGIVGAALMTLLVRQFLK